MQLLQHHKLKCGLWRRAAQATCHSSHKPITYVDHQHNMALSSGTLLEALGRAGVQEARIVPAHEPQVAAAAAIKTMVLVRDDLGTATQHIPAVQVAAAPAAAVAVLLLAGHRVDVRAVAHHMQLPRGSLRLATVEEAEASTGYELGCIPPLGECLPVTSRGPVVVFLAPTCTRANPHCTEACLCIALAVVT